MESDIRNWTDWLRDQGLEVCEYTTPSAAFESGWDPIARRKLEDLIVEYIHG